MATQKKKAAAKKKAATKKKKVEVIPPFVYDSESHDEQLEQLGDLSTRLSPLHNEDDEVIEALDGTVLLIRYKDDENGDPTGPFKPIRLTRGDFPGDRKGTMAWWDYKISICEYRKALAAKKGDPDARKRNKLERMLKAAGSLASDLGLSEEDIKALRAAANA